MIEVKALPEHALERAFHLKMEGLDDDSSKDKCEAAPLPAVEEIAYLDTWGASIRHPLSSIPYLKPFTYDELMSVTRLLLAKTESSGL